MGESKLEFDYKNLNFTQMRSFSCYKHQILANYSNTEMAYESYSHDNFIKFSILIMWDVHSEKQLWDCNMRDVCHVMTFSKDGKYVATGCHEGQILLYDAKNGNNIYDFNHPDSGNPLVNLSFSTSGSLLGCFENGDICLMDFSQNPVTEEYILQQAETQATIHHACISNNGQKIVLTKGNDLFIWTYGNGDEIKGEKEEEGNVSNFSFSSDDKRIVSLSGGKVCVFNAETGKYILRPFVAHNGGAISVAFSNDNRMIVTTGKDPKLKYAVCVWDSNSGICLLEPVPVHADTHYTHTSLSAFFCDNDELIVAGSDDGRIHVWNFVKCIIDQYRKKYIPEVSRLDMAGYTNDYPTGDALRIFWREKVLNYKGALDNLASYPVLQLKIEEEKKKRWMSESQKRGKTVNLPTEEPGEEKTVKLRL